MGAGRLERTNWSRSGETVRRRAFLFPPPRSIGGRGVFLSGVGCVLWGRVDDAPPVRSIPSSSTVRPSVRPPCLPGPPRPWLAPGSLRLESDPVRLVPPPDQLVVPIISAPPGPVSAPTAPMVASPTPIRPTGRGASLPATVGRRPLLSPANWSPSVLLPVRKNHRVLRPSDRTNWLSVPSDSGDRSPDQLAGAPSPPSGPPIDDQLVAAPPTAGHPRLPPPVRPRPCPVLFPTNGSPSLPPGTPSPPKRSPVAGRTNWS